MNIAQLLPALMRTLVPLLYGLLIQWGLGKVMPDQYVTWVATAILLAGIYLVLRILEHYKRYVGIALGWVGAPQYANVVQGAVVSAHDEVLSELRDQVLELQKSVGEVAESVAAKKKVQAAVAGHAKATAKQVEKALAAATRKAPAKKKATSKTPVK